MKTKIIYISGNEIFDIQDIRAAFEEVRNALNLDKTTVLFGVPVDAEDAGFATKSDESVATDIETIPVIETTEITEAIIESEPIETLVESDTETVEMETKTESVNEQPVKKRGRPRKTESEPEENSTESVAVSTDEQNESTEEKVVPILSVLSSETTQDEPEEINDIEQDKNIEIIPEISDEIVDKTEQENPEEQFSDDEEADLEKLLSAMTPLQEDIPEKPIQDENIKETKTDSDYDVSIDATLEQLATEFAENQDKIVSETKSNARSKIGKLRNILPFKQSKHKDQGLGDLFGWAGIAANDEDFSVPGFFTSAASKK